MADIIYGLDLDAHKLSDYRSFVLLHPYLGWVVDLLPACGCGSPDCLHPYPRIVWSAPMGFNESVSVSGFDLPQDDKTHEGRLKYLSAIREGIDTCLPSFITKDIRIHLVDPEWQAKSNSPEMAKLVFDNLIPPSDTHWPGFSRWMREIESLANLPHGQLKH